MCLARNTKKRPVGADGPRRNPHFQYQYERSVLIGESRQLQRLKGLVVKSMLEQAVQRRLLLNVGIGIHSNRTYKCKVKCDRTTSTFHAFKNDGLVTFPAGFAKFCVGKPAGCDAGSVAAGIDSSSSLLAWWKKKGAGTAYMLSQKRLNLFSCKVPVGFRRQRNWGAGDADYRRCQV